MNKTTVFYVYGNIGSHRRLLSLAWQSDKALELCVEFSKMGYERCFYTDAKPDVSGAFSQRRVA